MPHQQERFLFRWKWLLIVAVSTAMCRSCEAFAGVQSMRLLGTASTTATATRTTTITTQLYGQKDETEQDNNNNKKKKSIDPNLSKPISLYELDQLEQKASKRVMDNLLFPQRIGDAITSMGWVFLFSFFILEAFGYTYIPNPNGPGITIGTMESRDFQTEVKLSIKQQKQLKLEKQQQQVQEQLQELTSTD